MTNNDYINRSDVLAQVEWIGDNATWDNLYPEGVSAVTEQNIESIPAADVVPASAYNAAVETIRKLLCSEYGDSCQFCVWHNDPDAACARIGGSGGWCCENARWIGAEDLQPAGKLATDKQDRCKLPASYQQVNRWIPVEERLPEDDKPVLCLVEGWIHQVLRYNPTFGAFNVYKTIDTALEVTHWMPLPEPPEARCEIK